MNLSQMNDITSFEGILFTSVSQARRLAAVAGGYAVTIGGKCYVVPERELSRIEAAGVEIRIVYAPGDSNRRPAILGKGRYHRTTISH